MIRYVLLRHDCPADYRDGPHWDLMLEQSGVLRTWSLLTLPTAWAKATGNAESAQAAVAVEQLPDHRIAYLDYEGEVSHGRGTVTRHAAGDFEWRVDEPQRVVVRATNGALAGKWTLTREANGEWRLSTQQEA